MVALQLRPHQKATKDKRQELDKAEVELVAFASGDKDSPTKPGTNLTVLFRKIREAINDPKRPLEDLKWTGDIIIDAKPETDDGKKEPKKKPEAEQAKNPKPEPKPQWNGLGLIILVVEL